MLKNIQKYFQFAWDIFYPKLCLACEAESYSGEIPVCVKCLNELPLARVQNDKQNLVTERILGRVQVHAATAVLIFTKKGKVHHSIYLAKYAVVPQSTKLIVNLIVISSK